MEVEQQAASSSSAVDVAEETKKVEDLPQPPSPNALKVAATDCLNSWIYYLQMLNNLCSAGLRLSHSLTTLAQSHGVSVAVQNLAAWDELTKSTVVASHAVKTHIASAMQDLCIGETFSDIDAQRQHDHNRRVITDNVLTFVNLQYQFSIAGCECLGSMAMCPSCQTTAGAVHDADCGMAGLQQCFARLYEGQQQQQRSSGSSPHAVEENSPSSRGPSPVHGGFIETIRGPLPNPGQLHTMKGPFARGSRSPLHFPLFPLTGQRRWSEAAAGEVAGDGGDGTMRRWSMPWDCGRAEAAWQQRYLPSKLAVPSGASQDRSRSTTPECITQAGTITSGEGLSEAIQLLSCRPMRCVIPQGAYGTQSQGSTTWGETHDERVHKRYAGPLQRGGWQSVDAAHSSGMPATEHYDIFPPGMPLTSRKSSSSTDSSSCLSIHSRSTTGSGGSESLSSGGDAIRLHTNLYSMWSGNEHLPFIRLPESQEPQDESDDADDTPTDRNGGKPLFPRPT